MKKKKKRMLSIAGMCCCGFLAAVTAVSGTSAYLTDHEEVVNVITMGKNEITPPEVFPPIPTPVPPSGSVVKKYRPKILAMYRAMCVPMWFAASQLKQ